MKRVIIIFFVSMLAWPFAGCVTKQKYTELESRYKKCRDDLTFAGSENVDLAGAKRQLEAESAALKSRVAELENDTLSLSRKLRQTTRDLAKATRDYDELQRNFADLNANSSHRVNDLQADIDQYRDRLNAQRDSLEAAKTGLASQQQRLEEMQNILDRKDAEVKALKEKVSNALKSFEGSGLDVHEKDGKVYVSMNDKLLFASGSWTINRNGMEAIRQLAGVLETETDISVLIEGHTDAVPYRGNGQVSDNWDLSVMRATAVVKALLRHGNIDPVRLSASGRSKYLPVDNADTPEARAKNRRTEIILAPNLSALFQLINNNN